MVVLGGFDRHGEAALLGQAREFMATWATGVLSLAVLAPTDEKGKTLDLLFCTEWLPTFLIGGMLANQPVLQSDHIC